VKTIKQSVNDERARLHHRGQSRALGAQDAVEAVLAGDAKTVSLATVLGWPIPAGHDASETAAIPPRESKLYTDSGFVCKIKQSDDDCDLHLEIADSGRPDSARVIVEIPAAHTSLQKKAMGMFNLSTDVQRRPRRSRRFRVESFFLGKSR
jgi:hypothetical protein